MTRNLLASGACFMTRPTHRDRKTLLPRSQPFFSNCIRRCVSQHGENHSCRSRLSGKSRDSIFALTPSLDSLVAFSPFIMTSKRGCRLFAHPDKVESSHLV